MRNGIGKAQSGVTLTEVVVATAIMAIGVLAAASLLNHLSAVQAVGVQRADAVDERRALKAGIERFLSRRISIDSLGFTDGVRTLSGGAGCSSACSALEILARDAAFPNYRHVRFQTACVAKASLGLPASAPVAVDGCGSCAGGDVAVIQVFEKDGFYNPTWTFVRQIPATKPNLASGVAAAQACFSYAGGPTLYMQAAFQYYGLKGKLVELDPKLHVSNSAYDIREVTRSWMVQME